MTLRPLAGAGSGATALLDRPIRIQTPWLTVESKAHFQEGKMSLVLAGCDDFLDWLRRLEGVMLSQLRGAEDVQATFLSCVRDGGWKLAVTPACTTYGPPVQADGRVCLILDILGVWCWRRMSGLKVKPSQLKHLAGHTVPPTETGQAPGCSPGTSEASGPPPP